MNLRGDVVAAIVTLMDWTEGTDAISAIAIHDHATEANLILRGKWYFEERKVTSRFVVKLGASKAEIVEALRLARIALMGGPREPAHGDAINEKLVAVAAVKKSVAAAKEPEGPATESCLVLQCPTCQTAVLAARGSYWDDRDVKHQHQPGDATKELVAAVKGEGDAP